MARMSAFLILFQIITLPMLGGHAENSPIETLLSGFMEQMTSNSGSGNNGAGLVGQLLGTLMQGDNMKNLQGNSCGNCGNKQRIPRDTSDVNLNAIIEMFANKSSDVVEDNNKNAAVANERAAVNTALLNVLANSLMKISQNQNNAPPPPPQPQGPSVEGILGAILSPIFGVLQSTMPYSPANPYNGYNAFAANSPSNNYNNNNNNNNNNDFLQNFKMPSFFEMLTRLGSMLSGENGQIDPNLIGGMLSMFAQQMAQPKRNKRESTDESNDLNLEGLMGLASAFMGGNQNGGQNAADFLPVIMNALGSLSNPEAQKRAEDHKDHADFLPPFLEKAHLYWDLFINSELGKTIWEKSGMKRALKSFTGPDGKLSFELMLKNFENQSFRRHWIKAAAKYLTDMVVRIAKPEVYQKYLASAQYLINSFLDSQGLPKSAHFDVKKPEKSIAAMINQALRKYLSVDTDVTSFVKPAVDYLKQTMKMAEAASQKLANRGDYSAVADRVTDTLNLEVIEPVLRVYRAYQHSVKAPQCQEHLMCLVNRHHDKDKQGLPGFKAALTKFSSLIASAALSYQNGGGFWDLYNAIQNDVNCNAAYPADCEAFHEHEMKVTTEVYHSEL